MCVEQVGERWMWRQTWAEIDLGRLRHNLAVIQARVGRRVQIMASVKANAYGHGVVAVSRALLAAGTHALGVATVEEATELRAAGIVAPILCYGALPPDVEDVVARQEIAVTVMDTAEIERLARTAKSLGRVVHVHVKVDTGMGRLGVRGTANAVRVLQAAVTTPGVRLAGAYTHFSSADEPLSAEHSETVRQADEFDAVIAQARHQGIPVSSVHAANSAAIFRGARFHYDLVRPGIALYGYHPLSVSEQDERLLPVLSLYTRVVRLAELPVGAGVSYGRTFVCERPEQIATLPIGYADGIARALSNIGRVAVKGHAAPIAGRICMDQMMVVATGHDLQVGERVQIYGDGEEGIASLAAAAHLVGSIPYELLCAISGRVPRIYV